MDGNGRWAAAKGLPRLEGHRRGAERLIEIIDACIDGGIGTLTVFAFSAENWKRPLEEVSGLFKLGEWILRAHLARLEKRNVRLRVIGDISALPEFVRVPLEDVIKSSKDNTAFTLVVALNYGARQEIVAAAQALAADVATGKLKPDEVDWSTVETRLQTAGMPDPDLIIRTSGEFRLSNFLLLQSAYAEIVFATPERLALLKDFIQSLQQNLSLVERGDKAEFKARFREIAQWFGPFSEQAMRESTFLVEKLVHRF